MLRRISPYILLVAGLLLLTQSAITQAEGGKQGEAVTQTDAEATKRKAEALIAYLEKTKDKRVDKVVVNKYSLAGIPSEDFVNYNIRIGDVKYIVIRQGKDKKDENYLSFAVKTAKLANITIDDEGVDGIIDRGMDLMIATKEEKKTYGTKTYQLKERERWQAEYEKAIDALIQFLGIAEPQS